MIHGVTQTGLRAGGLGSCVWIKRSWWLCLILFASLSASALEVQEVKWGFDGRVVPGRFNLLTILVANSSPEPFDGTVDFYKSRGMERVGAIYGAPCYLSPMTTRWLQFYVFIDNQYDQWRAEWGRGPTDSYEVPAPEWGAPAQVLLSDSDTTLSAQSAFKRFPEELFPSTAAGTAGLDSLLLDHAPHWEPVQRQAFLRWLRAGGKLHLLTGADGHYPEFTDELAVLNTSAERQTIGAGVLARHAATASRIQPSDVREKGVPLRQYKTGDSAPPAQTADSFFQVLGGLSQRRYSWGGIYLLAIVYVALVGPGNLLAGRKLTDYRLRIVLLLATVGLFAFLFNLVGRRGQNEANVVHSLSYARATGDDTYDVMQWVNVFASRGSRYTITHAALENIYATGQDYESVDGLVTNGKEGRFVVDIPMFSHRAFLHAAEMKGPRIPVKILNWNGAETLNHLALDVGPDFMKQVLDGWVVQGDRIYPMKATQSGLVFGNSRSDSVAGFIAESALPPMPFNNGRQPVDKAEAAEGQFRKLAKPLIAWNLGTGDFTHPGATSPSENRRVQLFLFARSPQSFGIQGAELGHEIGYVLYHFDLFKPGT